MGDVFTFLIDGTSGLVPGGVDGKALVAGVCSKGQVGKGYLIGKRSDLNALLGVGPLVDRIRDILATGGQNPYLVAVPVAGPEAGYISQPVGKGQNVVQVVPRAIGVAQKNADIVVTVETAGQVGIATVKVSTDNGKTFGSAQAINASYSIPGTGATLVFAEEDILTSGVSYRFITRTSIGPITQHGDGPAIGVTGEVLAGAEIVVQVIKPGTLNEGTFRVSVDGGDNYALARTIPVDGVYELPDYGVSLTFPEGTYAGGATYECRLLPPTPSIVDVMTALERPLALYDVEFIYVVGESDSVDWAAGAAKMDELWNLHRPTYIKFETRLPYDDEDLNDYTAYLLAEKQGVAARFVQPCCQFGEVAESTGQRKLRNWAGLQVGRVLSIPVQRATGRVRDGNIVPGTLPDGWEAVQPTLEAAGYLTAKKYAGLDGAYWGDSRTLADATSDFRYEEVLRVTFKATRLLRIQALKSQYDEAGDPLNLSDDKSGGLAFLKANLENALDTMTGAIPKELAAYVIEIPPGQDIANNGVVAEYTLIGIPIIRQQKLYGKYVYAGSKFDPRLSTLPF
jgi:hypothetical protein